MHALPAQSQRAHTTAERQVKALEVVVIPSLGLRDEILWRGPLNEPRRPIEALVEKPSRSSVKPVT
jgi:hypothetical protein